ASLYFLQGSKISKNPEDVAWIGELRAVVGRDRRAAVGQRDRVALRPEANGARVHDLLRAGLELRADRRGEVDLFAPGLRGGGERDFFENGFCRCRIFQIDEEGIAADIDLDPHPPSVAL